jgi:SAM-dependent methyltransferase
MPDFVVEFGDGEERPADGRLRAAAFVRNHQPIWSVIGRFLADRSGNVLELGSGTGEHVVAFARASPGVTWWPSDASRRHLASIAAWRAHAGLPNVEAPIRIDLLPDEWDRELPVRDPLLAMLCVNVFHITPWRVTENVLAGAGRRLQPDGRLFVYGPFRREGAHTAPSNAEFDAALRRENPGWGVRDTGEIAEAAARHGLRIGEIAAMPANNFTLVLERADRSGG